MPIDATLTRRGHLILRKEMSDKCPPCLCQDILLQCLALITSVNDRTIGFRVFDDGLDLDCTECITGVTEVTLGR